MAAGDDSPLSEGGVFITVMATATGTAYRVVEFEVLRTGESLRLWRREVVARNFYDRDYAFCAACNRAEHRRECLMTRPVSSGSLLLKLIMRRDISILHYQDMPRTEDGAISVRRVMDWFYEQTNCTMARERQ
jgi:hypothetical protein